MIILNFRNKKGASGSKPLVPLEDLFPNAFCWIAHPKESSFNYIKKYIAKHYKDLGDVEGKPLWNVSNHSYTSQRMINRNHSLVIILLFAPINRVQTVQLSSGNRGCFEKGSVETRHRRRKERHILPRRRGQEERRKVRGCHRGRHHRQ